MTQPRKAVLACLAAALTSGAVGAQAQWVMVARAVAVRVQQMSERSKDGGGYDVATVVLEANADKVYEMVINNLSASTDVKITSKDPKRRLVQFTNGVQVAGMQ